MADATTEFLKRLDSPEHWVIVRNVPVFKPHVRRDKDGKEKYRVTEKDMESISKVAHQRERSSGVVGTLTIGHKLLDPHTPETRQPKVVGYVRNYRDAEFGKEKTPCVLVDLYYSREDWEEARKYPFRSAEYYPNRKEITGVALLTRDPELDLGMVAYLRQSEGPYYYSEANMADDPTTPPKLKSEDPDQPGESGKAVGKEDEKHKPGEGPESVHPDGVDPAYHDMFMRCMKHHGYPEKYSMGASPAPVAPGPMNGSIPAPARRPELMQRADDPQLLARIDARLAEQGTQLEAVTKELATSREAAKRAKVERIADKLDNHGYHYARESFIKRCLPLDDKGIEAEANEVITYSRQDVTKIGGGRQLPTSEPDSIVTLNRTPSDEPRNETEGDTVINYMREQAIAGKEVSWSDALKAVRGKK